ncbi:MAG: hypothetical protein Q9174_003978 [Haloplaca sp. 1 TL-2023]
MPTDDYSSAAGGGLRLKGVNTSSKISKHKKKRPKTSAEAKQGSPSQNPEVRSPKKTDEEAPNAQDKDQADVETTKEESIAAQTRGKTLAEIQHEERRRRRLEERLKREGTKTHKERVEEFNHYLSNLSEHHDMPRIGPG